MAGREEIVSTLSLQGITPASDFVEPCRSFPRSRNNVNRTTEVTSWANRYVIFATLDSVMKVCEGIAGSARKQRPPSLIKIDAVK